LALNATIEAARAGDARRGFAAGNIGRRAFALAMTRSDSASTGFARAVA